jgi:hypothetical protein
MSISNREPVGTAEPSQTVGWLFYAAGDWDRFMPLVRRLLARRTAVGERRASAHRCQRLSIGGNGGAFTIEHLSDDRGAGLTL